MASLRDIRRRIKGVKNIRQVTKAMNMIAAARLRRAQQKAESARPYADRLAEILQDVMASSGGAAQMGSVRPYSTSRPSAYQTRRETRRT